MNNDRIQPPGFWHKVYTPIKSIISGGHFYCYDALRYTEIARAFDKNYSLSSTNAEHDSSDRTLIRMALAIPYIVQERCMFLCSFSKHILLSFIPALSRASLVALAAMLKHPQDYQPEIDPDVPALKLRKTDFLYAEENEERRLALKIIDRVLEAMGITNSNILEQLESSETDCVDLAPVFRDWDTSSSA